MIIAIDGYNFIKQFPGLRRLEEIDLQKAREGLIEMLVQYKRIKGHSITVVFDGAQAWPAEPGERNRGIRVIFSREGEKADDVLKRLAAEKREGLLLVTSDREVALFAEKKGARVIDSSEFGERLEMARFVSLKGGEGEDRGEVRPVAPEKKGPSRRLSKSRRKTLAAIKKL